MRLFKCWSPDFPALAGRRLRRLPTMRDGIVSSSHFMDAQKAPHDHITGPILRQYSAKKFVWVLVTYRAASWQMFEGAT
jgi:hypothetical protein